MYRCEPSRTDPIDCCVCGETMQAMFDDRMASTLFHCYDCKHWTYMLSGRTPLEYHMKFERWRYGTKTSEKSVYVTRHKGLREVFRNSTFDSVIDFGGGAGGFCATWSSKWRRVCIDPSPIEKEEIPQGIIHIRGGVETLLDVEDADLVTAYHVLEHVEDPNKTLCELMKKAKKAVIVELPVHRSIRHFTGHINEFSAKSARGFFGLPHHGWKLQSVAKGGVDRSLRAVWMKQWI